MGKQVVLVCGNIAAGKSTVMKLLARDLNWSAYYEDIADNPYLADFYKDMNLWAFHLQTYLLGHRIKQQLRAAKDEKSAFVESGVYPSVTVFSQVLHERGEFTKRDFESYTDLARIVMEAAPKPTRLVYLSTSPATLLERIKSRARSYEMGITVEYLEDLEEKYFSWLEDAPCPITILRNDGLTERKTALIIKEILRGDE